MRFFLLPLLLVVFGCSSSDSPKLAPVKGTVTMKGSPLANVGVTFLPKAKGPSASGNTNERGEFTLMTNRPGDGAVIGSHQVTIGSAEEGGPKAGAPKIPDRYALPHTTDLTAEVEPGKTNTFTFDLKP
jgi:hypothetical protein